MFWTSITNYFEHIIPFFYGHSENIMNEKKDKSLITENSNEISTSYEAFKSMIFDQKYSSSVKFFGSFGFSLGALKVLLDYANKPTKNFRPILTQTAGLTITGLVAGKLFEFFPYTIVNKNSLKSQTPSSDQKNCHESNPKEKFKADTFTPIFAGVSCTASLLGFGFIAAMADGSAIAYPEAFRLALLILAVGISAGVTADYSSYRVNRFFKERPRLSEEVLLLEPSYQADNKA